MTRRLTALDEEGVSERAVTDVCFFPGRRRHTRYIGDWSSDVCSPDLSGAKAGASCSLHTRSVRTHSRYPDGIAGKNFFQQDAPAFAPEWVRTERVWSEQAGREIDQIGRASCRERVGISGVGVASRADD